MRLGMLELGPDAMMEAVHAETAAGPQKQFRMLVAKIIDAMTAICH
jgi:hypothetical protein